jgi:hypothetical protein
MAIIAVLLFCAGAAWLLTAQQAASRAGPRCCLCTRIVGGAVSDRRTCETCGVKLGPRDVEARLGIGGGMVAAASAAAI